MSNHPSPLGTLLATRLDAVLGTTLAQHPVLLDVARSTLVEPSAHLHGQATTIRDTHLPPGARATVQGRASTDIAARYTHRPAPAQVSPNQPGFTPRSAQIQLSETGKLMLALLLSQHHKPPIAQGKQPLLRPTAGGSAATRGRESANPGYTPSASSRASPSIDDDTSYPRVVNAHRNREDAARAPVHRSSPASAEDQAGRQPLAHRSNQGGSDIGEGRAFSGSDRTDLSRSDPTRAPATARGPSSGAGGPRAAGTRGLQASGALARVYSALNGPAAPLARSLAEALSYSGAFYESHLAEVAFGQRSPATLRYEPQAHLALDRAMREQTRQRASTSAAPGSSDAPARALAGGGQFISATPLAGLHPDAVPYVHQQLDVLANGSFAWHGEAWPNAPMDWEVFAPREQTATPPPSDEDTWSTRLRLELPQLGLIEVVIQIHENRCIVSLVAPDSADLLDTERAALQERFRAAQLILGQLSIASDPQARDDQQAGTTA